MAPKPVFKCPEDGCGMYMVGVDATEWEEFIPFHKYLKHSKNFEKTDLGRLPMEVLLKILGYVVTDCKDCFLQRDLLRLGMVCKKLNQLTKLPDFYKQIQLSDVCCPLPSSDVFDRMIGRPSL